MRSAPWPVRSRTRGARTATGPMPVMISRSGRWPWRTSRRRPSSVRASEWPSRNAATSGLDRPRQQGPGAAAQHLGQRIGKRRWLGKLQNGIVTHGVSLLRWRSGGSITPTIRRLNPSPRHQLLAIARPALMRRLFELAALPTRDRFCPLKVCAVVLLLLVLVLSSWRPAVALRPAMTCGDPQEPGLEHLSQCNDPEGVIHFGIGRERHRRNRRNISFEVSLTSRTRLAVQRGLVDFRLYGRLRGEDYTDARGTLTLASGETTKTISISLLDDSASEGVEPFTLSLANASGANFVDLESRNK